MIVRPPFSGIIGPSSAGSLLPILDDYNRADNASTLNTSSSGHLWTAHVGTWGTESNQGYLSSPTTDSVATVESGESNVIVKVTLAVIGNRPGLSFRFTDVSNYLVWFRIGGLGYHCWKRVAGTWNGPLHSESMATGNGDIPEVRLNDDQVSLYVNNVLKATITESFNQSATRHGLYHETGGTESARWENFSITE